MRNKTTPYEPIFPLESNAEAEREDDLDGALALLQWALLTISFAVCAGVIAGLLG